MRQMRTPLTSKCRPTSNFDIIYASHHHYLNLWRDVCNLVEVRGDLLVVVLVVGPHKGQGPGMLGEEGLEGLDPGVWMEQVVPEDQLEDFRGQHWG